MFTDASFRGWNSNVGFLAAVGGASSKLIGAFDAFTFL